MLWSAGHSGQMMKLFRWYIIQYERVEYISNQAHEKQAKKSYM